MRMKPTAESSDVMDSGHDEPTSGIILVDKPSGVTSHDVVAAVRSGLGMRRVGHAGTLDPMATGLLVVGFGQATRLLTVIVGHDKTYRATMRLGLGTTTDDADGDSLPVRPGAAQKVDELTAQGLQDLIDHCFTGWIDQVPDAFSAIKVEGMTWLAQARRSSWNPAAFGSYPSVCLTFAVWICPTRAPEWSMRMWR